MNPDTKMNADCKLPIVEIFSSYQGEGANTGRPVTFVRLAGCNLNCPWCDTDQSHAQRMDLDEIVQSVSDFRVPSVILTGGEPTIYLKELQGLIGCLRTQAGVSWVGLETNGVISPDVRADSGVGPLFDYVACSPKFEFAERYNPSTMIRRADEIRIVASSPGIVPFCRQMRDLITAKRYYISPCERGGKMDLAVAYAVLGQLNARSEPAAPWHLSVQVHKLLGIR